MATPKPFDPSKGAFSTAFITSLVQGIQSAQERNLAQSSQDRKLQQQTLEGLVKYGQELNSTAGDEITSLGIAGLTELGDAKTNFLGVLQKSKTLPQIRALVGRLGAARRPAGEAVGEITGPADTQPADIPSRPVSGLLDMPSFSGDSPQPGGIGQGEGSPLAGLLGGAGGGGGILSALTGAGGAQTGPPAPSMALPTTNPTVAKDQAAGATMAPPQPIGDFARATGSMVGPGSEPPAGISIGAPQAGPVPPDQQVQKIDDTPQGIQKAIQILNQDKYALDPHLGVLRRIFQNGAALGLSLKEIREQAVLELNPRYAALLAAREAGTTRVTVAEKQIEGRGALEDKKATNKKDLLDITNTVPLSAEDMKEFGIPTPEGFKGTVRMDKTLFKEYSRQEAVDKQQAGAGERAATVASRMGGRTTWRQVEDPEAPGQTVLMALPTNAPAGTTHAAAPTADMRNKKAARERAANTIGAVKEIGDKIIKRVGPAQRLDALKRGAEAVFGNDPEFRTYQDARMALAVNIAVTQQGQRPSNEDVRKGTLPLVPDAYTDTAESAAMKWGLIDVIIGGGGAKPKSGGASADPLGILK